MRILFVVHGFPPAALGGTEIYAHELALRLHKDHGDEVWVLAREADVARAEHAVREVELDGLRVVFVNNTFSSCRSFAETYRNPAIRRIAARLLDNLQPEVVHIHHLTCLSTEIVFEAKQRAIPVVFTLHDFWLLCHRGQLLDTDLERCAGPDRGCARCIGPAAGAGETGYRTADMLRKLDTMLPSVLVRPLRRLGERLTGATGADAARRAADERLAHMRRISSTVDLFLAPSDTVRDHILQLAVDPARVRRVHLGIDQRPFAGLERSTGDQLRIGFLGSLMVSKAPHVLLEAFAELPDGAASLTLFGAPVDYHGDSSYRRVLESLLSLPGVQHRGGIPHHEIPAELASLDVVVIPSVWLENSPLVIREAFLAGVPVIASDLGGMAESVRHEVDGLLFPAGDVGALHQALLRLIDEPGLLDRLHAGIPAVRSVRDDAAVTRELYASLLTSRAARPPRQRLAAVVLNYRTSHDTVLAVRSLQSSERPVDRVIVIDNGSDDGSVDFLREHLSGVDLVETGANLGFSGGCNVGIRRALDDGAELVFLLNADALIAPGTLAALESALAAQEHAGIAGPTTLHRADPSRIATAGISFSALTGRMRNLHVNETFDVDSPPPTLEVDAVAGSAMLITRETLAAVGLLDEDFFFSFEEISYCLNARRFGFATILVGDAAAYHAGSAAIGPGSPERVYYATRNHLLAAQRAAPTNRVHHLLRSLAIVAYSLTFAVVNPQIGTGQGVRAALRGARDFFSGRFGPAESNRSSARDS